MSSILYGFFGGRTAQPHTDARSRETETITQYLTLTGDPEATGEEVAEAAKRVADAAAANAANEEEKPYSQKLLENISGLVPLETIAIWQLVELAYVDVKEGATDQESILTVSDASTLKFVFWAAIIFAFVITIVPYLWGGNQTKLSKKAFTLKGLLLALVSSVAFFFWQVLPDPSAIRQALSWETNRWYWVALMLAALFFVTVGLAGIKPRKV